MNDLYSPIHTDSDYHQEQISSEPDSNPIIGGIDDWKTLEGFVEAHDQFQLSQLRWLLRHRKGNGLGKAVRKVGKRIYIHDRLFAEWMMKNV